MNLASCPICGIRCKQTRRDGQCMGCGKPLPEELRAMVILPDETTYASSAKELINRADTMGYDTARMISDSRWVELVHELERIGGAALMDLICEQVLRATDRGRADNFMNAWLLALEFKDYPVRFVPGTANKPWWRFW